MDRNSGDMYTEPALFLLCVRLGHSSTATLIFLWRSPYVHRSSRATLHHKWAIDSCSRSIMALRQRLEVIADQIDALCNFTKSISIRLLDAAAWLLLLFIVGRALWHGL
jgi:hypothetical protein